jgi:prepilin-type N-terminal cleavage/methylation domain-containing protein
MRRSAFTLIEMLISVVILSIILIFLYNTLSNLKLSNSFFEKKVDELAFKERFYKTLYLDISMSKKASLQIHSISKEFDTLIFQTSHSLHQRVMPYIAYIIKEKTLYRIESLKPISYPIENLENSISIDEIGIFENFRVYKKDNVEKNSLSILLDVRVNKRDIVPIQIATFNF